MVGANALFLLEGGEISSNTAPGGGGVRVEGAGGAFTMRGGVITANRATGSNGVGGGVSVNGRAFSMMGGEISGNAANGEGGGVHIQGNQAFTKMGGVIMGQTGSFNDNTARWGHAVSVASPARVRNSTAGENVRLSSATAGAWGGWEN